MQDCREVQDLITELTDLRQALKKDIEGATNQIVALRHDTAILYNIVKDASKTFSEGARSIKSYSWTGNYMRLISALTGVILVLSVVVCGYSLGLFK